jgi:hypothetical protein
VAISLKFTPLLLMATELQQAAWIPVCEFGIPITGMERSLDYVEFH